LRIQDDDSPWCRQDEQGYFALVDCDLWKNLEEEEVIKERVKIIKAGKNKEICENEGALKTTLSFNYTNCRSDGAGRYNIRAYTTLQFILTMAAHILSRIMNDNN